MRKLKKIVSLCMCLCFILGYTTSYASDVYYHKPYEKIIDGVKYIDDIPVYKSTPKNVFAKSIVSKTFSKTLLRDVIVPVEKWYIDSTNFYYTAEDKNSVKIKNSIPSEWTLATTSETYAEITGSMKFGFKEIAESEMTVKVGEKWGKTFSVTYKKSEMEKNTEYFLKSACKVKKSKWRYLKDPLFGNTTKVYIAYTHDKDSNKHWIWEEKI